MAVEARQMNLLPSHLIRDFNVNSRNLESGLNFPAGMADNNLLALYQSSVCDPVKTDSGVTYNFPATVQRKRPRESFDGLKLSGVPSFIDHNMIFQIQQYQSEIDRFVAEHAEKVAMELEKRRHQESRMLVAEIYERIAKKMKEKDEEIERMGKVKWALEERMKSLCVENQVWRELAQSNEATANSLRSNLEHVLARASQERHSAAAAEVNDAESSCGSSGGAGWIEEEEKDVGGGGGRWERRMCRKCGAKESCVLVLPCRHLCLCTMCGSTLHTCPVCNSTMNASVHVNMS